MRYLVAAAFAGAAVLAGGFAVADTQAYPHIKSGLWQQDMTMRGRHLSDQACVDAASEAKMSAFSKQLRDKNCQSSHIAHNADGSWTSTATCTFGTSVRTSRTDISGDLDTKYTVTMRTPPDAPPVMTMTSVRLGDCKAGQRGGDVIMSNGMKMNMMDTSPPPAGH